MGRGGARKEKEKRQNVFSYWSLALDSTYVSRTAIAAVYRTSRLLEDVLHAALGLDRVFLNFFLSTLPY